VNAKSTIRILGFGEKKKKQKIQKKTRAIRMSLGAVKEVALVRKFVISIDAYKTNVFPYVSQMLAIT
jgi:hypothetical protein